MAKKSTKGSPNSLSVPSAPPKKGGTKKMPSKVSSSGNLTKASSSETVLVNFRISPEFRRDLKGEALDKDTTMTELLHRMYAFWKEHN